jgi:hypothetical protein
MSIKDLSSSSSFEAADDYQAVPASTTVVFQGKRGTVGGKIGDYLRIVTIVPTTTSPGAVTIKDGTDTAITIFPGGASSVQGLASFQVFLDLKSKVGGWTIATGANVSVLVSGDAT